jgi:ATP-binding cassette subfamily B protein
MLKIVKRLPPAQCLIAIAFLLIQIVTTLYLPYVTADIVDNGVRAADIPYIWSKGNLMFLLSAFGLVGALCNTFLFSRISYRLGGAVRSDIYRKVLSFSKHEFDRIGTSSLITRTTNDVTQVQTLVEGGLKFLIMAPAMLIGGIIMTGLLSPVLALVFLGAVPVLGVSYFVIYRYANPLYAKMQRLLDKLNLLFREGLTGVKVIRAFDKDDQEYEKYRAFNREYTRTFVTAGTIMSVAIPLVTMLVSLATVLITWIGGLGVGDGTIEVGVIMAAITYSVQILMGFAMLTTVIVSIPRGQISAQRINEVLDLPLSIKESLEPETLVEAMKTTLTFENVDFRYQGARHRTLSDISFSVHTGQTLAIIGSTGDGKTSLVNLLSRLYDVESGSIRISGTDIRSLEQKRLRDLVSFCPQKSTLFFGSIRSNMQEGKPDADDAQITEALAVAQAADFVDDLPNGLDSAVDKDGGNFSGGQKQRLCIARTLIKDAAIYVFDDSFSALDFKTDRAVREAMRPKLKDAITVIVAQRIGTVMDADVILVLDKGRVAGLGDHETLKETNAVYQEIIDSQFHREARAS